ncbi:GNAT family N-acetyltransferase [Streptodolium elevatio]|uniref:GNAT family N-acetyltransferase n=1 Tax=Streptodolium elevatio TaxID=3157996 RepID=A0ABV3DEU2_9ACTN
MSDISTRWYRPGTIPITELSELATMFAEVADDFVPPLTSRAGTTQSELREQSPGTPVSDRYLKEMLRQDLFMTWHKGRLAGFLSFRTDHHDSRYADLCPCLYVSTIAIRRRHRRHGIARSLYRELFDLPAHLPPWVVLRTWSTNHSHLELLRHLGFDGILRLQDDRAPGVDTVYLAAKRSASANPLPR